MVIVLMYFRKENEVIFILCTYMELVDREVIGKQKELLVDIVRGVLGAKIEYMAMTSRSVPENHLYSRQMLGVGLKLYNSDI